MDDRSPVGGWSFGEGGAGGTGGAFIASASGGTAGGADGSTMGRPEEEESLLTLCTTAREALLSNDLAALACFLESFERVTGDRSPQCVGESEASRTRMDLGERSLIEVRL